MLTGIEVLKMLQDESFVEGDRLFAVREETYNRYIFNGNGKKFIDYDNNTLDLVDLVSCKFIIEYSDNKLEKELDEAEKEISKLKSIIKGNDESIKKLQSTNLSNQLVINDLKSANEELRKSTNQINLLNTLCDCSSITNRYLANERDELKDKIKEQNQVIENYKIQVEELNKELKNSKKILMDTLTFKTIDGSKISANVLSAEDIAKGSIPNMKISSDGHLFINGKIRTGNIDNTVKKYIEDKEQIKKIDVSTKTLSEETDRWIENVIRQLQIKE